MSDIKNGIARSRKVVVYLSENYRNEAKPKEKSASDVEVPSDTEDASPSDKEVVLINEKASRFSRDAVIVLKHKSVSLAECASIFPSSTSLVIEEEELRDDQFASKLADDILKEPNCMLVTMPKKNTGHGAAVGYFYGYLRLVLPDFKKRLLTETLRGATDDVLKNTVEKMLIIMPESCFCPPTFTADPKFKFTNKFVCRTANRAGNVNRDYKSSLFSVDDAESDKTYYFVGELATPLLTMYESYYFDMMGMTLDELYAERDAFYWTLKAVLNHPKNKSCHDQFELLVWKSDPESGSSGTKVEFYDFVMPEIKRLIESQTSQESSKGTAQLCTDGVESSEAPSGGDKTFTIVEHYGANPAAIYEKALIREYPLSRENRGICLVICNNTFMKDELDLGARAGSAFDIDLVQKVFSDLKFQVQVHEDLSRENLERLLLTTNRLDHSDFSAFACVFMTHGRLGVVYTADSLPIRILDVVDYFGEQHCPSLVGKPKMFFIQACQRGPSDEVYEQPVRPLASDGDDRSLEEDAAKEITLRPETDNKLRSMLVPSEPDFVMSYATLPGSTAYRDPLIGSLYISELGKQLGGSNLELDRALKLVTQGVKASLQPDYERTPNMSKQLPFHLTTTDKLINL